MKKNIIYKLLLMYFLLCTTVIAKGKDVFTLAQYKDAKVSSVVIGNTFSSDKSIQLPNVKKSVIGLSINGKIDRNDHEYFVRIVLKDKEGKEHLVMESYDEINDTSSFILENYCEETALLPNIIPDSLFIFVFNAKLQLDQISFSYLDDKSVFNPSSYRSLKKNLRQEQSQIKAEKINSYNKKHKKLWFAGVTDLCMADFSTRIRQLGFSISQNTGGLEYYIGGVFEMGAPIFRGPPNYSPYVKNFDWRNRHGRSWMTPVKNQGGSMYCSSFSSIGALESLTNLHYNQSLNLDLSEQEAACCNTYLHPDLYYWGMPIDSVLLYITSHGVCDETSYPFVDYPQNCRSGEITPQYQVQPYGYRNIGINPDSIKKCLIHHGPLVSGYYGSVAYDINTGDTILEGGHAMALVGYGTIQAGDKYSAINNNGVFLESDSIDVRDERVGLTYWIFKNSYYGQHQWEHDGYMYLIFNNAQWMFPPYAYDLPVMTEGVNAEIVWEDSDGDGYYFWGLGPKPSSCPYWVPDIPDGDDSNPQKGAMNIYGNMANIGPFSSTYTIVSTVNYNINRGMNYDIVISDGGHLNITSEVVMANCKIYVESGGTLVVDGGRLLHANIELNPSSNLVIKNNGLIHMKPGVLFNAPIGANVTIESGEIS